MWHVLSLQDFMGPLQNFTSDFHLLKNIHFITYLSHRLVEPPSVPKHGLSDVILRLVLTLSRALVIVRGQRNIDAGGVHHHGSMSDKRFAPTVAKAVGEACTAALHSGVTGDWCYERACDEGQRFCSHSVNLVLMRKLTSWVLQAQYQQLEPWELR